MVERVLYKKLSNENIFDVERGNTGKKSISI